MSETIVAIATAPGTGGISIVRLSGECAVSIADRCFCGKTPIGHMQANLLQFGRFVVDGRVIDECMAVRFRSPHSFTGEDVVEFHLHGGSMISDIVIKTCISLGAKMAGRGEFTKRAFLNGKIDLSQAEAIVDMINAKTERMLHVAVNQLEGKLTEKINSIRQELLRLLAEIEVVIDYPDEDVTNTSTRQISVSLHKVYDELTHMLNQADSGKILRNGASCAILGRPNTGKSSLLNALLGESRAIVSDIAGTTRDIVEDYCNIGGIAVKLGDTAGLRKGESIIECEGINRAHKYAEKADICLLVLDNSSPLIAEDYTCLDRLKDRKIITCVNKIDAIEAGNDYFKFPNVVPISAKTGAGLDKLRSAVYQLLVGESTFREGEAILTNVRQEESVRAARTHISDAFSALEQGYPTDVIAIDLQEAIQNLGVMQGIGVGDEVIELIFSTFCLGK